MAVANEKTQPPGTRCRLAAFYIHLSLGQGLGHRIRQDPDDRLGSAPVGVDADHPFIEGRVDLPEGARDAIEHRGHLIFAFGTDGVR